MEKLLLDDFTNYKFLSGIKFSPNGQHTGFVCHHIDLEKNSYLSNIYILDGYNNLMLLTSLDEEKNFVWKNSETILFPAFRSKEEKERRKNGEAFTPFYEISIKGEEAKKSFEVPLNVKSVKIIDEDTILLTGVCDPRMEGFDTLSHSQKEDFLKELKDEKDFEILDEIPFWSNGVGFNNKKRNRLYIFNIKENSLHPITDKFSDVYSYEINQDKSLIILISNSYIDKRYSKTDLQIYNILEDRLEKISPTENFYYSYANFLGDKICFLGSSMKTYGINENPHFYLTNYEGYDMVQISNDDFDFSTRNSIGSDCRYGNYNTTIVDGDYLYFVTTEGDSSFINRIDITGKINKLTSKKGSIDDLDVYGDNIQFIGLRSLRLQEVYSLKNKDEIKLTRFNDWVMKEKTLSIPEKLTFKTKEEVLIEGWVLKPVDFTIGQSYPAILNIHGGPKTSYGEVFFHEMQYWANEGYVVFFCNPRGSDGRGNAFADIRGKYGTIDYEDIMDFTDLVLEKYHFIDKDRLGVTGGSYGGFMTNWIIGHTNRFKAAVSQRSIANWISKFATTDIGYYFVDDQISATPWNDYEKLWNHSPMKYADKISTPTLFIHSQEDYRCWLTEGIQMFTSLKYHGVESKLCIFRGENHELSRSGKPKNRIKRLEEITKWFDKYLK